MRKYLPETQAWKEHFGTGPRTPSPLPSIMHGAATIFLCFGQFSPTELTVQLLLTAARMWIAIITRAMSGPEPAVRLRIQRLLEGNQVQLSKSPLLSRIATRGWPTRRTPAVS